MCPLKVLLPLLLALGLTACLLPTAKEVDVPLAATRDLVDVLNYRRLSAASEAYLESRDLSRLQRQDPLGLIVTLKRELDASPTVALRQVLLELCMDLAGRQQAARPGEAIGLYLAAAELAFQAQRGESALTMDQTELLAGYNFSAGQVARLLYDGGRDGAALGSDFAGPWSSYALSVQRGDIDLSAVDALIPAELLKLKHTAIERYRRDGFGAAMVGHRPAAAQADAEQGLVSPVGMALALNASLDFGAPERVVLTYRDVSKAEEMPLGSRRVPLAADFTAPLVMLYDYIEEPNIAWKGMLHPEAYADHSRLAHFSPFRADRIPVVMIHGLISSPKIWLPLLNRLNADPQLRERYQLFVFVYPSGFPITYNAEVLRRELLRLKAAYNAGGGQAALSNLLLIGHSMGGVLSSMQIRDSGDTLERAIFTVPIDGLSRASAEQKATLKALLTYESSPDISRVVFVATPHRGSDVAESARGRIGAALITIDPDLLLAPPLPPEAEWTPYGYQLIGDGPNGIRSLVPESPGLLAVVDQPVRPGVAYHSIIGQKGPEVPRDEGTDGTVAYWSSHLEGAASEKIIFAKHTPMVGDPATIEELRRILHLHAGLPYPAP